MNLFDYIHDGGVLSYVLIALSVIALASFLYNLLDIRPARQAPKGIIDRLDELFRAGQFEEARLFAAEPRFDCLLTRIVHAALDRCLAGPAGIVDFRSAVESVGPTEVDRLHRRNDWIGIIAAVAPMLGLLGTVIGMIGALRAIGTMTGAQRSNELATFMSMALVNTAEGLVVAIPCTVAFAFLRRRADDVVAYVSDRLDHLGAMVQGKAGLESRSGTAPRRSGASTAEPAAAVPVGKT